MTKPRAALLLLCVFLAGTVAGAVGGAAWVGFRGRPWGSPRQPERMERMVVRRIARRLDLDADQRRILERVAGETRGRMEEVRRKALGQVGEILDRAFEELEPTLRPEQREEFRRMRQEADARLRGGGGPPERGRRGGR